MIRDILLLQKREFESKTTESYIERNVKKIDFNTNIIKVIIGPRRAGKSFYAVRTLNKTGTVGYCNFDDEKLVELKDYNELITTINSIYNNPKYLLFDEIQNLDKWELFVNRLQREGHNLVITGSNSNLLSKELSTHLTGRHTAINIFPFSFKELLSIDTNKQLTENEIKTKLFNYITYGGYPEPYIKKLDYKDYLTNLFNSIIYKDIIKRYKIRFVTAIEDLSTYLISNIASEFSYNTLTKVTKCKSVHTAEKYLHYLEESFIFFKISRFSYKLKEQISSNKKIYCVDNGYIYAKAFNFSQNLGKLYENIVAIELQKLEINKDINVYYWKNTQQEEVDFIIKRGTQIEQLIQVCYDITDTKTKEREKRALIKASNELKCDNLLIITENLDKEESFEWYGTKRTIKYIPLWKWLL